MHANIVQPDKKYNSAAIQELKTLVEEKLRTRFSESIMSATIDYDFPVFTVRREIVIDVLDYLYHETGLEFQFLMVLFLLELILDKVHYWQYSKSGKFRYNCAPKARYRYIFFPTNN